MSDTLSVADVLERAAAVLDERGWTQGQWQDDETGCLCLEGALTVAGGLARYADADRSPAGLFFEDVLMRDGFCPDMPAWNDAEGRTKEDVTAKLREAAALARGEQPS